MKPSAEVLALLLRGKAAADRGSSRAAESLFDRAVALDADCAYGYFYRAGLRLLRGSVEEAAADFARLESIPPKRLVDYRELDNHLPDRAPDLLRRLDALLRRRPRLRWAHVLRAFALRNQNRNDEAVAAMQRAVRAAPLDPIMLAFLARVRIVYRYVDGGAADLVRAASLARDCGWVRAWLGEARRRQGRFAQALRCLDRAIVLAPGYSRAYAWRGAVRLQLGRAGEALRDLDRALAADPRSAWGIEAAAGADYSYAWTLNQRSMARRVAGDVEGALDDLARARAINPRYSWAYVPEPSAQAYGAALRPLDALLERRPRHAWAHGWKGLTLLEAGDAEGARASLDTAVRLKPRAAWLRVWRGRARDAVGDAAGAGSDFSAAARLDPRCSEAHARLGGLLRARGRHGAAIARLNLAVRHDPLCAWAYAWRGEAYLRMGRLAAAGADLDRAIGIHDAYAEAYAWRGEVRRQGGRAREALADFTRALELRPDQRWVYAARSMVRRRLGDHRGQRADMTLAVSGVS